MTLDQRIEKDLTELYEGKEITCAKELQSVLEVSAKGLPQPDKRKCSYAKMSAGTTSILFAKILCKQTESKCPDSLC